MKTNQWIKGSLVFEQQSYTLFIPANINSPEIYGNAV